MSWEIGQKIDQYLEDSQKNSDAVYGKKLLEQLEKDTGIVARTLYQMHNFYKTYPTLPSEEKKLNWSHYRNLIAVKDDTKRALLEDLVVKNNLGTDKLQRAITEENKRQANKKAPKILVQKAQLKVTRGRLFAHKITALSNSKKTFVDLGFNMFCEIKTTLKVETIVESKKGGEKISLRTSDVKPAQMHTYKAYLERVVDGDTIHVILDLGFKMQHREILRLAKINAPEMKTAEGKKSSDALKEILKDLPFLIVKTNKTDIYGRYVADVFFSENKKETDLQKVADEGIYLSQLLLDQNLVEKY